MVRVGVFALQGDVSEHVSVLTKLGCEVCYVRNPKDLDEIERLIIPGGESTVFAKLSHGNNLDKKICERVQSGMPIFGTCAGMILLSKGIVGFPNQPTWGLMDIKVKRNAYGRQLQSSIKDIEVNGIGTMNVAFIRAPIITSIGDGVEILAKDKESNIILARERNMLAGAFHPEITGETRLHEFFLAV